MGSREHNLAVLGQVAAMIFAQLSHALRLNDICDCLRFHKGCHVQIRNRVPPSRNGLTHANVTRDAGLAEGLFWTVLIDIKEKYPQFIFGERHYPGMPWCFKRAIHVVDSTTIQLIVKCMNWAKYSQQKTAAKMHLNLPSAGAFLYFYGIL